MKSFSLSEYSEKLNGQYLDTTDLKLAIKNANDSELKGIIHQWFSEGIPHCFHTQPLLYESSRLFLARRLNLHPKEITIIGSSRLGYTIKPKKFGQAFDDNSDLDLTIISNLLFEKCKAEYEMFADDFKFSKISPNNEYERRCWIDNLDELPANIRNGFIDSWRLPNNYHLISTINDTIWQLKEKLSMNSNVPKFKKISARIYSQWGDFTKQLMRNLISVKEKL